VVNKSTLPLGCTATRPKGQGRKKLKALGLGLACSPFFYGSRAVTACCAEETTSLIKVLNKALCLKF